MAGRLLIVSGAALFALGAVVADALFEEPGGDADRRRPVQLAAADPEWGAWEPAAPELAVTALPEPVTTEPAAEEDEEVPAADEAPLPHVWATPAEWSEVE